MFKYTSGNMYVQYIDAPAPSTHMKLEEVQTLKNEWAHFSLGPTYSAHDVEQELMNELYKTFPPNIFNAYLYQCIGPSIPIHKDIARDTCFNYILNTGGDNVETVWYDDNYKEIHREYIEPNRWHQLKVDVLHTVEGITNKRYGITVNE